ncbi:hypothetical protein [Streptomyces fuscichromogenes]|uniref:Excreted virulence factor EspC (Type VII ESX diderm) n=1 Tax=Streptomyces fuscichromogenes TaxID=1324013 RepID=A0A917XML4_9ACTN|nr:hypothetical protein [Streptomyces fuscichromogenes]GGN38638.1 hypothetical protein GCM10011578_084230 [Streptomyces fuscichromogenes]
MGDRTRIDDLDVLKSVSMGIQKIVEELQGLDDKGTYGWSREVVGHEELTDRLDDFADNWDYRRGKLEGELTKLAAITKAAAQAYEQIDTDLADAVREREKKPRRQGR